MGFMNEISKLLKNKYFLYFIVFLAITNLFGYLAANNFTAVVFFILVGFLTYQFNKNMVIVLLVALIFTNFIMFNKKREGLENTTPDISKIESVDSDIANAIPIVQNSKNVDEVQSKIDSLSSNLQTNPTNPLIDINNSDLNKSTDSNAPQGVGEKISAKKGKTEEHFGHRLDYAATIDESYQHLDQLLGSDSIQKLSKDTQKLMQQQQNLFNTMNQMVPVLEGAQNMLKGFDMNSMFKSIKNIGGSDSK
jgi:hypothetical protein